MNEEKIKYIGSVIAIFSFMIVFISISIAIGIDIKEGNLYGNEIAENAYFFVIIALVFNIIAVMDAFVMLLFAFYWRFKNKLKT